MTPAGTMTPAELDAARGVSRIAITVEAWTERSACGPDDDMYPADGDRAGVATAKAVCDACPVIDSCLSIAMARREKFGIWGGTTPDERAKMIRSGDTARWRANRDTRMPIAHGTKQGYRTHKKRGEDACGLCREAERQYSIDRRNAAKAAAS